MQLKKEQKHEKEKPKKREEKKKDNLYNIVEIISVIETYLEIFMIYKIIIMKHFNLNENEFNNIINECVKNVLAKNTTYLNEGRYHSNLKAYKDKVQPVMDKLTDTF